ncbi:MAG TPA: dienelactone hydrolase family protein [Acidimicrobiia bacterium]|nr:dienelactone hydrolase family protein [Acidimicrobiia bacterium]
MGGDLTLYVPGDAMPGYLSVPSSVGPWPGVVVLHEAFGLNDDIRRITDRVASLGYLAVAPDLLAGGRIRCLARIMRDVQRGNGETVAQVESLAEWLQDRADCSGRVGVVGFCLGGGLAFAAGCRGVFAASAPNYGVIPSPEDLARSCPVVASFGGRDRFLARKAMRVSGILDEAGVASDIKIYPQAGHSFMNQSDGNQVVKTLGRPLLAAGFERAAAEDAWLRIEAFFALHLANSQ